MKMVSDASIWASAATELVNIAAWLSWSQYGWCCGDDLLRGLHLAVGNVRKQIGGSGLLSVRSTPQLSGLIDDHPDFCCPTSMPVLALRLGSLWRKRLRLQRCIRLHALYPKPSEIASI